ncbi:MAG: hypothetical protein Q9213_003321 [Squamulea squamosa]
MGDAQGTDPAALSPGGGSLSYEAVPLFTVPLTLPNSRHSRKYVASQYHMLATYPSGNILHTASRRVLVQTYSIDDRPQSFAVVSSMVYCGPLSKACQPCRKRKLRCDLRRDACTQCTRAQLECYGYRDTDALRFRDESTAVQNRVVSKKPVAPVPQSLPVSIRSQARDVFYYNYVVGLAKPFDFLQAVYSPASKDDHLSRSVDAVALAYLHSHRPSVRVEEEARQTYVSAINCVSGALQNPDLAQQDSTIIAILLLDLYEKITTREPAFHGAWAAHLSGALTLVKLRGDEQFNDPSIVRVLMRLSTNLLISCVASNRPVLYDLVTLRHTIAARFPTPPDPKWQESDLVIEFASLRQDIMKGILTDNEATIALIELDAKFVTLGMQVPPDWQYATVRVDAKSNHHYESFHHIHPAEHIAQMWNTLRLTRILLNEIICSKCLDTQGRPKPNPQFQTIHKRATGAIKEMAIDICASLPQYIDDPPISFLQAFSQTGSSSAAPDLGKCDTPVGQPDPTRHLPCYRLIFPLYIAAQSSAAPPSLWKWVIKQLRFMADYHAIENAMTVAKILESGHKRPPWDIYAMLGSYAFVC